MMPQAKDAEIRASVDGLWAQLESVLNSPDIFEMNLRGRLEPNDKILTESPVTKVLMGETFKRVKEELYDGSVEYLHHPNKWTRVLFEAYVRHWVAVMQDAKDNKIDLGKFGRQVIEGYDFATDLERIGREMPHTIETLTGNTSAYQKAFAEGDYDRARRINDGMRAARGDTFGEETVEFYNNDIDIATATGDVARYLEVVKLMTSQADPRIRWHRPNFEETVGKLIATAYKPALLLVPTRPLTQPEQMNLQDMFYTGLVSKVANSIEAQPVSTPGDFENLVKRTASEQAHSIAMFYPVSMIASVRYGELPARNTNRVIL